MFAVLSSVQWFFRALRSLLLLTLSAIGLDVEAQPVATPPAELTQLRKVILERHTQPALVDNDFSSRVLNLLLDELDPEKLYFTAEDVKKLTSVADKIDNDMHSGSWVFFPVFESTYREALMRAERILHETAQRSVLLPTKVLKFDTAWASNEQGLRMVWESYFRDEALYDLAVARRARQQEEESKFLAAQEPLSRKKTEAIETRRIRRALDHVSGFQNHCLTLYFNAVATAFDPHTVYFSTTQMQNFMARLSTEGYYFGFGVRENESGELEIANLMPGGPAWKSGGMTTGDVMERLRWEGKEWMDLAGVTEEELDDKLGESNASQMEFVLRKTNGMKTNVVLRKEKLDSEESVVRGFILQGKRKIGFISLPDFYSSWGDEDGSRCAGDVAAEILKLKMQGIEGLIIDLRYNGGGSLLEAVQMAGIFIDAGPVGIETMKGMNEPFTLKDMNRGTVYDGPLVLLVNNLSASASELVAAVLQDYRRAIIVGGRTYGKATAQEMFSLRPGKAEVDLEKNEGGNWGFAKVTTGKMYRVNGKSIQKHGVVPDITLPDIVELYGFRESSQPYALSSDSVFKKTYWAPVGTIPYDELRATSAARVAKSPAFGAVSRYMEHMWQNADAPPTTSWKSAQDELVVLDRHVAEVKKTMETPTASFTVSLHDFGKSRMEIDEYANTVNQAWIKNLSTDIFVEEAFNIICDYVNSVTRH